MSSLNKRTLSLTVSLLLLTSALAGCKEESKGGDTVPAPPRELIEKSYKTGNFGAPPPPQPGATKTR